MAISCAATRPSNLVSLGWQPWWEFRLVRHLQASSFEPTPSVDAGFLSIRPRRVPLLDVEHLPSYRSMLAHAFTRRGMPGINVPMPCIMGIDFAGDIVEIGSEVSAFRVGDRVILSDMTAFDGHDRIKLN